MWGGVVGGWVGGGGLPSSERTSMLPLLVVMFSVASTSVVPAQAVMEVLAANSLVSAFILSWLASWMRTWLPVVLTVTWPVKLFNALNRSIFAAPP